MRSINKLSLIGLLLLPFCLDTGKSFAGSLADRRKPPVFDYSYRRLGFGGYIGMGVASSGGGVGFEFGATTKIGLWKGLMLEPGFNMYIRSGLWAIALAPAPQWIFRFRKVKIHPYVGFGPGLYIVGRSAENDLSDIYGNYWNLFDQNTGAGTSVKFGLHWTWGAELALTRNISLYNDYKFILAFQEADLFSLTFGMVYYLK